MKRILLSTLVASSLVVSAQAAGIQYSVNFSGLNESPVNASPGIGSGLVEYDPSAHTLALNATFSGLTGTTTASHIHAATAVPIFGNAGVATTTPTFALFPLGVSGGVFSSILDMTLASSYNPAYVTANGGTTALAETALATAMAQGKAYWNIHTTTFGGGEIRGFLTPVPEPGSLALTGFGAVGMAALAWKKRRANKPKP